MIKGRLEITLDDQTIEIDPGSWIHMDANLTHAVVALEPSVMILTLQRST